MPTQFTATGVTAAIQTDLQKSGPITYYADPVLTADEAWAELARRVAQKRGITGWVQAFWIVDPIGELGCSLLATPGGDLLSPSPCGRYLLSTDDTAYDLA